MSRAARTVLAFGIYVMVTGAAIAAAPNLVLALLGFPAAQEIWIRVFGAQVVVVGFYYTAAARGEAVAFFRATRFGRSGMAVFFTVLVALGLTPPMLLLFGVVEVLGALWTHAALRADAREAPPRTPAGRGPRRAHAS